ncbi:mitochondrial ribosome-associated GTPase 1-like [Styela clava]
MQVFLDRLSRSSIILIVYIMFYYAIKYYIVSHSLIDVDLIDMGAMRESFDFGTKKMLGHWFPRHMGKGLRQMRAVLRKIDCVIEVHDCRIPMSGRNPALQMSLSAKPKLLVFNKVDSAQPTDKELELLHDRLRTEGVLDYLFTNCLPGDNGELDASVSEVIPRCVEIINRDERYDREGEAGIEMMIVGVPNVGKSSLINALRRTHLQKGKAAAVGRSPGQTRSLMYKIKVCEKPLIYLHDTPGILEPKLKDLHSGMKLSLCNTIKDHLVGPAMIADYLLFTLNQKKQFKYMEKYGFQEPCDDIHKVLLNLAIKAKKYQNRKVLTGTGSQVIKIPDYNYAANLMLADFREGLLGKFIIDDLDESYDSIDYDWQ